MRWTHQDFIFALDLAHSVTSQGGRSEIIENERGGKLDYWCERRWLAYAREVKAFEQEETEHVGKSQIIEEWCNTGQKKKKDRLLAII